MTQRVHIRRYGGDLRVGEIHAAAAGAHGIRARRDLDLLLRDTAHDDRADLVVATRGQLIPLVVREHRAVGGADTLGAVAAHAAAIVEERIAERHVGRRDFGRELHSRDLRRGAAAGRSSATLVAGSKRDGGEGECEQTTHESGA